MMKVMIIWYCKNDFPYADDMFIKSFVGLVWIMALYKTP